MNIFDGRTIFLGPSQLTAEPPTQSSKPSAFAEQVTDNSDGLGLEELLQTGPNFDQIDQQPKAVIFGNAESMKVETLPVSDVKTGPKDDVHQGVPPSETGLSEAVTFEPAADIAKKPLDVVPVSVQQVGASSLGAEIRPALAPNKIEAKQTESLVPSGKSIGAKMPITGRDLGQQIPADKAQNNGPMGSEILEPAEEMFNRRSPPQHSSLVQKSQPPVISVNANQPIMVEVKSEASPGQPLLAEEPGTKEQPKPRIAPITPASAPSNAGERNVETGWRPGVEPSVPPKVVSTDSIGPTVDNSSGEIVRTKPVAPSAGKDVEAKALVVVKDSAANEVLTAPGQSASFEAPDAPASERRGKTSAVRPDVSHSVSQQAIALPVDDPLTIIDGFEAQVSNMRGVSTETVRDQAAHAIALVKPAEVARYVATQIPEVVQTGETKQIEIRLDPQELGKVRISLGIQDLGGSVSIIVERPETLDLMRRHTDQLMREFRNAGWNNVDLSMEQQQFGGSPSMAEQQGEQPMRHAEQNQPSDGLVDQLPFQHEMVVASPNLQNDRLDVRL